MIVRIKGRTCQYDGCREPATAIACGRVDGDFGDDRREPGVYCDAHAAVMSAEREPDCVTDCPNCGCRFGVK